MKYTLADFHPVTSRPELELYYCPGCNATPDDYAIPSHNCSVCRGRNGGGGVVTPEQMFAYLQDTAADLKG
jgi:hypothetical protein